MKHDLLRRLGESDLARFSGFRFDHFDRRAIRFQINGKFVGIYLISLRFSDEARAVRTIAREARTRLLELDKGSSSLHLFDDDARVTATVESLVFPNYSLDIGVRANRRREKK